MCMRILTSMVRGRDKKGISFTTYHQPFPLAIEPEPLETTNASVQNILVCFVVPCDQLRWSWEWPKWSMRKIVVLFEHKYMCQGGSHLVCLNLVAGCIWLLTLFQGRMFHPWKDIKLEKKEIKLEKKETLIEQGFFSGEIPPPFQISVCHFTSARIGIPQHIPLQSHHATSNFPHGQISASAIFCRATTWWNRKVEAKEALKQGWFNQP